MHVKHHFVQFNLQLGNTSQQTEHLRRQFQPTLMVSPGACRFHQLLALNAGEHMDPFRTVAFTPLAYPPLLKSTSHSPIKASLFKRKMIATWEVHLRRGA